MSHSIRSLLTAAASSGALVDATIRALDDNDAEVRIEQFVEAGMRRGADRVVGIGVNKLRLSSVHILGQSITIETAATKHPIGDVDLRGPLADTRDRLDAGESIQSINAEGRKAS